jgi:hypothetical protein
MRRGSGGNATDLAQPNSAPSAGCRACGPTKNPAATISQPYRVGQKLAERIPYLCHCERSEAISRFLLPLIPIPACHGACPIFPLPAFHAKGVRGQCNRFGAAKLCALGGSLPRAKRGGLGLRPHEKSRRANYSALSRRPENDPHNSTLSHCPGIPVA